jgi:hypothetical protein
MYLSRVEKYHNPLVAEGESRIYIYKTLNSYGGKNASEKHYMSTKKRKEYLTMLFV